MMCVRVCSFSITVAWPLSHSPRKELANGIVVGVVTRRMQLNDTQLHCLIGLRCIANDAGNERPFVPLFVDKHTG